jgi:uncharacterized RDD family membrane protein YckC
MNGGKTDEGELETESAAPDEAMPSVPEIAIPREGVPRYIAAGVDQLLMMVAIVLIAKFLHKRPDLWQWGTIVATYVGYYFLFEGLFARTPGKLLTGLVVVGYDGRRCTWRQAWTRNWMRLLEANPIILGEIPAALSIVFSRYHQRFGDKLARTVVVPRSSMVRR